MSRKTLYTRSRSRRRRRSRQPDPSPEQIAACCREIQRGWTEQQRRERCLATSPTAQRLLLQLAEWILPPPPQVAGTARLAAVRRRAALRENLSRTPAGQYTRS